MAPGRSQPLPTSRARCSPPTVSAPTTSSYGRPGSSSVTLTATPETLVPGRYGLWIDNGFGHVRIGDILRTDPEADVVERELIAVDRGYLAPGTARWNAYFHGAPPDVTIGAATEHVDVCR